MVVRFGLIVRIVQANFSYHEKKLFGDCGQYRIEFITNLYTSLLIVCLLTLHWKNVVLNIYGIW